MTSLRQRSTQDLIAGCLAILLAALVFTPATAAPDDTAAGVRLTSLSWQTGVRTTSLMIEASEPVSYLTSQPDPLTIVVDLRNVAVGGVERGLNPGSRGLVRGVSVEGLRGGDGTPVARVRVAMDRMAAHRVRSVRNVIYVDIDAGEKGGAGPKPGATSTQKPVVPGFSPARAPTRAGPVAPAFSPARAPALTGVTVSAAGGSATVSLRGNGPLVARSVEEAADLPPRVVLDFPELATTAPAVTPGQGPIKRVRAALHSAAPRLTRVVIDLVRRVPFRVQPAGDELRVVFDAGATPAPVAAAAVDPIAALNRSQAPAVVPLPAADLPPREAPAAAPLPAADARPRETPAAVPLPAADARPSEGPAAAPLPAAGVRPREAPPPAPLPIADMRPKEAPAPAPLPASNVAQARQSQQPLAAPQPPALPPPQPTPTVPGPSPTQPRQFQGHPVSLDFQGADLRAVLRTFAEISGLNIVIDPSVQGSVDVALRDVPWDQALDIILRANNLGYTVEGTIVRIVPLAVLAKEEQEKRRLQEEQVLAGEVRVLTRALSYARAETLGLLVRTSALTQRGSVQVDPRTNTMIITDLPQGLATADRLLTELDRPEPQVEIEARIVQTNRDFARAIGVQWGFTGLMLPRLGNTTDLAFPNQGGITGRGGVQGPRDQPAEQADTVISLGAPAATTAVGISMGSINGAVNLDLVLTALESSGRGRILSTPRVTTQNNIEAEITQGVQIPLQTVANNTVTVTFRDAALTLRVTPQITASDTVIMRIAVENASPDFANAINNIPPINTQRANTQVLVQDGQTTVIGGIYTSTETTATSRTPIVSRIPLLGWLFRRDEVNDESRELLIFITPRIIKI